MRGFDCWINRLARFESDDHGIDADDENAASERVGVRTRRSDRVVVAWLRSRSDSQRLDTPFSRAAASWRWSGYGLWEGCLECRVVCGIDGRCNFGGSGVWTCSTIRSWPLAVLRFAAFVSWDRLGVAYAGRRRAVGRPNCVGGDRDLLPWAADFVSAPNSKRHAINREKWRT
jgi:hypothetical protein